MIRPFSFGTGPEATSFEFSNQVVGSVQDVCLHEGLGLLGGTFSQGVKQEMVVLVCCPNSAFDGGIQPVR